MKSSRIKKDTVAENQTAITAFFQNAAKSEKTTKNLFSVMGQNKCQETENRISNLTLIRTKSTVHSTLDSEDVKHLKDVTCEDNFSPDVIEPTPENDKPPRKVNARKANQVRCKLFTEDVKDSINEMNPQLRSKIKLNCRTKPVKREAGCEETITLNQPTKFSKNVDEDFSYDEKQITVIKETQFVNNDESEVDKNKIVEGKIEEELTKIFDDDFLQYFDKMSPFKIHPEDNEPNPFFNGLGRHIVTNVEQNENEIILTVFNFDDNSEKICKLQEFWSQSNVRKGDVVNILSEFDDEHTTVINNTNGLIVINPDRLISGTSVMSSVFCMRKSVLMEKFRLPDAASFVMICGNLIHQIFQQAVIQRIYTIPGLHDVVAEITKLSSNLHAMYEANVTENEVVAEIEKYIPEIKSWIDKHVNVDEVNNRNKTDFRIVKIHDIEENIWSPRFGVKGKVDLTVEVELHKKRKIVPLELKTGKSSFSPEHQGQVILYSMMCSDRRDDPGGGLLLYLKDGKCREIVAEHNQKRGLIQLRNELAHYLTENVQDINLENLYLKLPEPLNNRRVCSNCPYLSLCCLYKSVDVDGSQLTADHDMTSLIPEATLHLSENHKKYFFHWHSLTELESTSNNNNFISDMYRNSSNEREERGLTFTRMKLSDAEKAIKTWSGNFLEKFEKSKGQTLNSKTGIVIGDMIILSCESTKQLAIASGIVVDIQEKFIVVEVDKNLRIGRDINSVEFRLDQYSYGYLSGISAGNLALLMEPTEKAEKLRRLIIDKDPPQFHHGLSQKVMKGKSLLKGLNPPQLRAIFKSLMAKDYLLIKGMPGTGKTSTIVALVRLLDLLGFSVLLTSYTHSAVDNILIKLKRLGVDFLRLGKEHKIHLDILSNACAKLVCNLKSIQEMKEFYQSKKIIATTCLGVNHSALKNRRFDYCIVDEATQIMQISCLGPLFFADRFILIGDPKQLPPLIQNKIAKQRGMDQSLFSLLDSSTSTIDLTLQYRMNSEIMSLCNKLVYDDNLKCGCEKISKNTIHIPKLHPLPSDSYLNFIISSELSHSVLFLNTDGIPAIETKGLKGFKNEIEANLVLQIILVFKEVGVDLEEIGVISFYSRQVIYLKQRLILNKLSNLIEVNTVDQYQGRDKRVIIVSFVRSSTKQLGDILNDIRRLNVAITRAKQKLILIGSISTMLNYVPVKKLISFLKSHQIINLTQSSVLSSDVNLIL